jgi:hypothetical protein
MGRWHDDRQRDRSAQTSSQINDQGASLSLEGSEGGSLDTSRERGESTRDISGTTAGGTEFSGQSERTDSGAVKTQLESESGGQMAIKRDSGDRSFVGQTESGDLYAGRNGEVYKRGEDGWQKYENGSWSDPQQRERHHDGTPPRNDFQSNAAQYDRNQLNRQYDARMNGQRNYNNYQRQGSYPTYRSRPMRRGRFR